MSTCPRTCASGRKRAERQHLGADLAEPGWQNSREGLERQMERQVGAVQEERPDTDGEGSAGDNAREIMFSILQMMEQLSIHQHRCNLPVCYFFGYRFRFLSIPEHSKRATDATHTISLGTIHLKEHPLGKVVFPEAQTLFNKQKQGPGFGFSLPAMPLGLGMSLAECCTGRVLSRLEWDQKMVQTRTTQPAKRCV